MCDKVATKLTVINKTLNSHFKNLKFNAEGQNHSSSQKATFVLEIKEQRCH